MKILITSILFLGASLAQAQTATNFQVTKGVPYMAVLPDATQKSYFTKGDEIITLKTQGKQAAIQRLNAKTLSLISTKQYTDLPEDVEVEGAVTLSGHYYMLYSVWKKPNEQLFYREIDLAKGEFIGDQRLLFKTEEKILAQYFDVSNFGIPIKYKFYFVTSYDQSKLLVHYRVKPESKVDRLNYDVIGTYVFDVRLTQEWGKSLKMPYSEKLMDNLDYSVDREGNCYMTAKVFDDNASSAAKKEKTNYHLEVWKVKAQTGELQIEQVNLLNKRVGKVWLFESSNDYLLGAGYYSKGETVYNAEGIFVFKVDKEGKITDLKTYDTAPFTDLELTDVFPQEDGGILLIGEERSNSATFHTSASVNSQSYMHYYTGNLLITKINARGESQWVQKLHKRQSSLKPQGGMTYQYVFNQGSHYLVFVDDAKNKNLPLNKPAELYIDTEGGLLTAYKITDAQGMVSKLSFFDIQTMDGTDLYSFSTDAIVPTSEGFVVSFYKKKKEDLLIKVVLQK